MLRRSSLVECVSVLHGTCLQSVKIFFIRQYVQPCLSKNPKYTFYTIKQYKSYFAPALGDSCIWTTIMLYMCISHEEDIVFAFTIKINFVYLFFYDTT
jgi:hypothetical protein